MGEEVLGWLVRVPAARKEREKLIEAGRCKLDPGFESTRFENLNPNEERNRFQRFQP